MGLRLVITLSGFYRFFSLSDCLRVAGVQSLPVIDHPLHLILTRFVFVFAAVVVSLYEDPIQPQQAASVVEKLGDYLVSCGF